MIRGKSYKPFDFLGLRIPRLQSCVDCRSPLVSYAVVAGLAFAAACTRPSRIDINKTLVSRGISRSYQIFLPPSSPPALSVPLVIVLHGGGGKGSQMNGLTHMNAIAAREEFLVAYPDGMQNGWADGRGATPSDQNGIDDVRFLSDMIDQLESEYPVDPRRIYITGISNGGFMTQRVGCELAGRIAAIAPVAAGLPANLSASCAPVRPIPVALFQGTDDPLVPYAGGTVAGRNGGETLGAQITFSFWATTEACQDPRQETDLPDTAPDDGTRVHRTAYRKCAGGSEILLYSIEGGGHAWPGGLPYLPDLVIGRTSQDMDASEEIWKFFVQHPLPN
jgi:polyhydroxybutyrate depolymerase